MDNPCQNTVTMLSTALTGVLALAGALLKTVMSQGKALKEIASKQSEINERLLEKVLPDSEE